MGGNLDPVAKDTPWHQVIQWSKLEMVREAIDSNPFGSDHFAWIDFSITHVAEPARSLPASSERVAILEILPVAPAEAEHRQEFYRLDRGRMAGGFFRGSRDTMLEFRRLFEGELAAALAMRLRPNEEMIYALLSARKPELFEVYYGGYPSILSNWDWPRSEFPYVMANVAFCRTHQLWDKALRVCRTVESGLQAGQLSLDNEQTAQWLDEFYVAAWYGGQRSRCPEIGHRLESLTLTKYFQNNAERLQGNLAFLDSE